MGMVSSGTNTSPEPCGLLKSLLGLIPFLPQLGVVGQMLFCSPRPVGMQEDVSPTTHCLAGFKHHLFSPQSLPRGCCIWGTS